MTTKTRDEFISRIAKNLGVLASGQNISTEDYASIEEAIDPSLDQVAAEEIVYVGDTSAIPNEWFFSLAAVVAFDLSADFSKFGEELVSLERKANKAKDALRLMTRGKPTGEPMPADYGKGAECENDTGYC